MDAEQLHRRREQRALERRRRHARRRMTALGALAVVLVVAVVVIVSAGSGSNPKPAAGAGADGSGGAAIASPASPSAAGHVTHATARRHHGQSTAAVLGPATGKPGTASVPVLMYHVIAAPPGGAPYPGLYVQPQEFAAQMAALKSAGWRAVTLDQLRAYWAHGAKLPPGKPIVITFDNGYHSQYTQALPVLRRMGWVADENIQLTGLPPSQGGMTTGQVRALVDDGWELDTQGISHADLATADAAELHYQVASARQILRRRYGVPVDWFCYPSGQYNPSVIAAVRSAGFVGSTTVVPGWAGPSTDPYTLPRLRVLGGTSPAGLLAQIASARTAPAPAGSYVTS
ncbi:MAG TPA: polysaccharide deacetylase family protein [Solirubrobacteraceae bacterium]|jgi:peptidoglycan/xylan/chitin deacetylase (PgdA/CDA1 family)|nr:polysaccharide deacetylase family protein [Solirubrobacteraceae bacterium]